MADDAAPSTPPQPSISWREYIQWVPDEPSEPTSTLVLTSPKRRFVDIRIKNAASDDEPTLPNEGAKRRPEL
ncbi:hypothetical protein ANO11243_020880 [Dothideomycetidae sp. 11243]|nr:hypothetical protein ANO11243_020880 [fungal sp. No.11243]